MNGEVEVLTNRIGGIGRHVDGGDVRAGVVERVGLARREAAAERIARDVGDAGAGGLDVETKRPFTRCRADRDRVGVTVDGDDSRDRSCCAAGGGELERGGRHIADVLGERHGVVQSGSGGRIGVGANARADRRRDAVDEDARG